MKKPVVVSDTGLFEERTRSTSLLVPFSFFNHFIGNLDNIFGTATTGGGGAAVTSNADCVQGQFGALRLRAGTAASGGALVHTGANMIRTSNQYGFRFICGAALPVLSNGTNRFLFRSGISTTPTTFGDSTGFYIRYVDNVNGGEFQGVVRNGATESTLDFNFAPVAGTPFIVGFEINETYTSIEFFNINNLGQKISRGSLALGGASLPAVNIIMGAFTSLQKSVGGSTIDCLLDFLFCEVF